MHPEVLGKLGFCAFLGQSETSRAGIKHDFCKRIFSSHQLFSALHKPENSHPCRMILTMSGQGFLTDQQFDFWIDFFYKRYP